MRARMRRLRLSGGPPRARRSLPGAGRRGVADGWTSACAEEPARHARRARPAGVDLRVRGGAARTCTSRTSRPGGPPRARRVCPGGPPRARRSRREHLTCRRGEGWTSACAEEPWTRDGTPNARWVDLRVRGGASSDETNAIHGSGGPPRARRSPAHGRAIRRGYGWTSACAEEPRSPRTTRTTSRVDLRVRGGARLIVRAWSQVTGGPPRARRSP